ncbi:PEGA domain-containing protein [Candidatus Sumerlaeota bacterium]|nr:PEGA domain-containing protein [Candidatus Sumerlaeota bacterium]
MTIKVSEKFLRLAGAVACIVGLAILAGCGVRQKVIVTSEPTGAVVSMNGVNLGRTPVEQPFLWFWYYDFIAEKKGYKTAGVRKRFRSPVWLWPPLDLVMEAMPFYVPSVKRVHIKMDPLQDRPAPSYEISEQASSS